MVLSLLALPGCVGLGRKPCTPSSVQVVKVTPPLSLYGDCGSALIRELTAGDTVADLVVQSNERKTELDKCIEAMRQVKAWSDMQ